MDSLYFSWYQDPEVIHLIDGSQEPYTLQAESKKCMTILLSVEKCIFIEVLTNAGWQPIGDVSFWQETCRYWPAFSCP